MIFLGVLLFALLVIAHEWGHFIVARRNGVEVEEFGIGFPPRLFGKKFGETFYTFNLLPLGGFVKLKGETDSDKRPGSFGAARLSTKAKVLMAGVAMNVVCIFVIILFLALTSLPSIFPGQYSVPANETVSRERIVAAQVNENSAAEEAGIEMGDEIVSVAGVEVTSPEGLQDVTGKHQGQPVELVFVRDGETLAARAKLGSNKKTGYLGVEPIELSTSRYTWAAPQVAFGITLQMLWLVLAALGGIILSLFIDTGAPATASLTGPVGIVFMLQNLGSFGLEYLLILVAAISASLAVFNALPIPALDGGRLALIAGARVLNKPLTPKVENAVHGTGFLALMALFVLITVLDVQKFF